MVLGMQLILGKNCDRMMMARGREAASRRRRLSTSREVMGCTSGPVRNTQSGDCGEAPNQAAASPRRRNAL